MLERIAGRDDIILKQTTDGRDLSGDRAIARDGCRDQVECGLSPLFVLIDHESFAAVSGGRETPCGGVDAAQVLIEHHKRRLGGAGLGGGHTARHLDLVPKIAKRGIPLRDDIVTRGERRDFRLLRRGDLRHAGIDVGEARLDPAIAVRGLLLGDQRDGLVQFRFRRGHVDGDLAQQDIHLPAGHRQADVIGIHLYLAEQKADLLCS
ncbi:MAG: hypothetical protein B7X67_07405 [Rhizobiales bacterium 39-66-18]|nr:MAG: hypothetical protein B7X67_07405 [Rhizobiales bacterium 39-66-18]